jgi:hypothetical protein
LEAIKEIDLYRAKYRHNDLTPHAWCFHGNQKQDWEGSISSRRLYIKEGTKRKSLSIDADTYKYISFNIEVPSYWIEQNITGTGGLGPEKQVAIPSGYYYKLKLRYGKTKITTSYPQGGGEVNTVTTIYYDSKEVDIYKGENFKIFDMSDEPDWTEDISEIEINLVLMKNGSEANRTINNKYVTPVALLEYFKVDNISLAEEIDVEYNIASADINNLRAVIDMLNKKPIDWDKKGSADDRVREFIDVIKLKNYDDILNSIKSLAPYNGCANCDAFTCSCYTLNYGYKACTPCNACNAFQACQVCDMTCNVEARAKCTCNQGCHSQGRACTCYAICYQHRAACRCNQARY